MWTLLTRTVRLVVLGAVALTGVAVVLGRAWSVPSDVRRMETPRYQAHDGRTIGAGDDDLRLLDLVSGAVERAQLPEPELLRFTACSPWRDGRGRMQLAGQWEGRDASGRVVSGLARIALPGFAVLDRIEIDFAPVGSPCWFPGPSARILFAGADGRLYRHSFEGPDDASPPLPLRWRARPLGMTSPTVMDPSWPVDSRLGGRLLVSLIVPDGTNLGRGPGKNQLWWLQLDSGISTVKAAGPLIVPGPAEGPSEDLAEERLASVSATPDGGLVVAYLVRRRDDPDLALRLAPVTIDPATGSPRVEAADAVELAKGRASALPAFSPDGRWVYAFARGKHSAGSADRFSVLDALAGRTARAASPRPASLPQL